MKRSHLEDMTRELVLMALMVALITIGAWISFPLAGIPITLQVFGVCMTLCLLETRQSLTVVAAYLLMGAIGLPVFSSFRSGIGTLFDTTGGYLLGFLPMVIVFDLIDYRFRLNRLWKRGLALFVSLLSCYLCGTLWYSFLYIRSSGIPGFISILTLCVIPYLLPDMLKIALAVYISDFLSRHHII